jgi:pimeloyl-ACP methyl ester carboxylesterase
MNSRSFRPRPARPTLHEPSLTPAIRAAVALLGARRVMTPPLRKRLELAGLPWAEIAPLLARVRTIDGWARVFGEAADEHERAGDAYRASVLAFLGHLVLSPYHPRKQVLQEQMRRCHIRYRMARTGVRFERLTLCGGALSVYWETPGGAAAAATLPTILLLPPLASTKEELALLADPLLDAGFPVLRMDMPGQGQSPPPLMPDAERLLMCGLDEAGISASGGLIAGGISLGAYYALRLAGADRERVRGAFGISPPAIITPAQWAKQPEVIWQYLDLYFAAESRADTHRIGLSMTFDDAVAHITCPVLLYHAANDRISLPDAQARYRTALSHATSLTDVLLPGGHGCLLHLKDRIGPEVVAWAKRIADSPGG